MGGVVPSPNIVDSIALAQQAGQNKLAEYQRTAQLQQQAQLAGQQSQLNTQQIEMQRRQMADQDALTRAITQYDPTKHTLADVPKLITQNGGSGQAALAAQQGLTAQREKLLQLSGEQFAQEQKKADLIAGVHDTVSQAPPEQKEQAYQEGLMSLARAGIDVSKESPNYPGDEEFAKHLAPIRLHSAIVAEAEKDRELTTKEQEANEKDWKTFPELGVAVNTRTGQQKNVGTNILTPAMQDSKFLDIEMRKNRGEKLSADDSAFDKAYRTKKELVPIANFNLQNNGAAADAGGNPSAIAQAIASNRMKWSEAVSPRTPQSTKNAIMAQVFKLNPSYDTSEFGLETDAAKKARSGAWADTRLAYNTAIDHSSQLLETIDALNNGDVKKLNSLKNFFKTEFGSPDVPTFQAVANAYNHEVTTVVSKGHITDAEVATGHATLPDNASPQALRGVVNAYKQLMSSKRDELDKIIKAGAGNKADSMLGVGANSAAETGGGRKVLSMSAIQQAAKDHGVSVDEAKRQAIAAGYSVQ
jgi:uncharacterized protein YidB (DUF937 family)